MEVSDIQPTARTESVKGLEKSQAPQKIGLADGVSVSKEAQFRDKLLEELKGMPEMRPREMEAAQRSTPSLSAIAQSIADAKI